ncbi:MAG TPA: hypothetical protein VHM19_09795, partial [Polyangiales bacterium]|nr:hypothetical protein [Polyangiales bacterium]
GVLGCINGHCCQSQTCTERGFDQRCGPTDDTCGNALWCGCGQSNGMRVEQRNACGHACADTLTKVNTCNTNAALETLDQTAGWDFGASVSRSICNGSYGFSPNWTNCHNDFEIDAQGFVHLAAGTHCFSITGSKTSACGALYFVSTPGTFTGWSNLAGTTAANVVTGNSPVCFTLAADDYYPIRWVYTQDNWLNDFHVNYCAGGPTGCSPIPSSMLYPAQ